MTVAALARAEIRKLRGYDAPSGGDQAIHLNANESPCAVASGLADGLNRYPAARPRRLTGKLAKHYNVDPDNVLVTRGSSEGIDLLMRTFCAPGEDEVLITPPAFEMYDVYAAIQGARVNRVPLRAEDDFGLDTEALLAAVSNRTKIILLCSPNNPVGTTVAKKDILRILESVSDQSIVVVDEAYVEFSSTQSLAPLVKKYENLVVLRTLSKGMALAGIRCGAIIGATELISLVDRVLAPFAMSSPAISSAEEAMEDDQLRLAKTLIDNVIGERERLRGALEDASDVEQIWPSEANFLFMRFNNLNAVHERVTNAGISIRTFSSDEVPEGCARISVGSAHENDCLIEAIRSG